MTSQSQTNDDQAIFNNESTQFRWIIGIILTIMFALIAVVYGFLRNADADSLQNIQTLQSQQSQDNMQFQNLNANIYIICRTLKADCLPALTVNN
jgi:hypothetical protein